MTVLLGLDDTDMPGTPGTGRLARTIASVIADLHPVLGITRHQLLIDPAIPYTSHNSSAVIHIDAGAGALAGIAATARDLVLDAFAPGADPGIAVVEIDAVPPALVAFGQDAKRCVLTADQAFRLAANGEIFLEPLDRKSVV